MASSMQQRFKKKGPHSLRDHISRKERELIQQACDDSRFQALFGKHLDAMERDWAAAIANLGAVDEYDTESTSSAASSSSQQNPDEDPVTAKVAAATTTATTATGTGTGTAMRRRSSCGSSSQKKLQQQLQQLSSSGETAPGPAAGLCDFDPRQSMTEWAKDCMRLCTEAWDMDKLLQERDRLAKQVQRFQEDKIDAQKGYMQELQVLKNQVLQLEKKTPNLEVEVTNDDLCFYEPLRYLPDNVREYVRDVICYKVKQEMDRGADLGAPQREKILMEKISTLEAEKIKLQSRLEDLKLEMENEMEQQVQKRLLKELEANRGNSKAAQDAAAAEEAARAAAAAESAARRRQAAMEAALADRNKASESTASFCPRCLGAPPKEEPLTKPKPSSPPAGPATTPAPEIVERIVPPDFRGADYLEKKVAAIKLSLSAAEFRGEIVLASGDKKKLQTLKEKIQGAKAKLAESFNDVDIGPELVCCSTMTEPWAPEPTSKPEGKRVPEPLPKAPKLAVVSADESPKKSNKDKDPPSPSHATQTDPASLSSRFSQTCNTSDADVPPASKGPPATSAQKKGASWRGLQFVGSAAKAPGSAAEAIEKSKQAMRHLRRGCSELARLQSECGSNMASEGSFDDFEIVANDMSKTIDCIDETLAQADSFIKDSKLSAKAATSPAAPPAEPQPQQPQPRAAPPPSVAAADRSAEYQRQIAEKDQEILDLQDKNTQLELALQEMQDKINEAKKQLEAAGIDADAIFEKVGLNSLTKGLRRVCVFERLYMDAIERAKRQAARAGLQHPTYTGIGGGGGGARLDVWGRAFREAQQAIHPEELPSPVTGLELQGFLQEAGLGQPGCPHCGMMLQWASSPSPAAASATVTAPTSPIAAAAAAATTTVAAATVPGTPAIPRATSISRIATSEAPSPSQASGGTCGISATRRSQVACGSPQARSSGVSQSVSSLPSSRSGASMGPVASGTPKDSQRTNPIPAPSLGSAFFPIHTPEPAPPTIGVQGTSLGGFFASGVPIGAVSLSGSLSASGLRQAKQLQVQEASGSTSPAKSSLSRRSLSSPLLGPESGSARLQVVRLRGPVNLESVPFLISAAAAAATAQSQLGEKSQLPPVDSPGRSQERRQQQNTPSHRQASRGPSNALLAAVDPLPLVGCIDEPCRAICDV